MASPGGGFRAPANRRPGLETRRRQIASTALDLFIANGYDETTVDAIADAAGVSRRTFFHYFRSKDQVVFPDHQRLIETVHGHLEANARVPPFEAVAEAVKLVFISYVADGPLARRRFALVRSNA